MNPEKELPIEEKLGLQIEQLSDSPKVTSENDFDVAFNKWLKQKGVGLYDTNISIVKDGTQFLIGPKNGTNFKEYIRIDNISLLKDFIRYTTDHYYRDLFTSVHNNFNLDISTKSVTKEVAGVKSTQEVLTVVFKEELDQLKEDISFQQIIDGCKALTTGGNITLPDGTKKFYAKGQYQELLQLIAVSKPRKDDIIYNQNLKIFTQIINEQKDNVGNIATQAVELRNNNYTQNHAEILQRRKQELDYVHGQYSQIEKYLTDPILMNKPFDASMYNTDLAIYSSKDIKTLQKKIWKQDIEMNNIDEGMFNTALLKLDLDDRQEFRKYLNEVIAGTKDPSKEKYKPKNKDKFDEIVRQYPALTGYINFYVDKSKFTPEVQGNVVDQDNSPDSDPNFKKNMEASPHYADRKEALAKWGIAGLTGFGIDKTNMNPEKKQFRWGVGQLAITAGAVIVWWKMLKSAFNLITGAHKGKEKEAERRKDRAWLLGPAAIVFWLQAATGEGIGGIINGGKGTEWLANIFGGSKDKTPDQNKKTEQFQEKYGEGVEWTIAIFNGSTYGDLSKMVEKRDGKMKLKTETRKAFMDKFGPNNPNKAEQNPAAYKFLNEVVGEKDENGMIDLSLNAMGISREKIQDTKNADMKINDTYAKVAVKLWTITAFMEEKWYSRINPDRMDKLEEYLRDNNATADDLDDLAEKYTDMFVKEEIKDNTGQKLLERIKEIAPNDTAKQEALMIGINKFYEYMPNATKKIEIIGNGPEVTFKTYDKETTINLDNKELVGFTASKFGSYFELFKAANLTNSIKDICKDKTAGVDPFNISQVGRDIEFDEDGRVTDLEIITGGLGGNLEDISPVLESHKDKYCTYLNGLKFRKPTATA